MTGCDVCGLAGPLWRGEQKSGLVTGESGKAPCRSAVRAKIVAMSSAPKLTVLFVCIGNACRSPMAECVARQRASDVMEPSSAGLYALGRIAARTEDALRANGYPFAELASKQLRREALENADLIINLSGAPLERYFEDLGPGITAKIEDWSVEDPYGEDPVTYQRILEEIESRVLRLASRLRAEQHTATA